MTKPAYNAGDIVIANVQHYRVRNSEHYWIANSSSSLLNRTKSTTLAFLIVKPLCDEDAFMYMTDKGLFYSLVEPAKPTIVYKRIKMFT